MSPAALSPNAWLRWDLVRRELARHPITSILEMGMGQGALGTTLETCYTYTGVEPDPQSRSVARGRLSAASRALASIDELDPEERFDALCSFEVLEHIEDDHGSLRSWVEHLRPGGVVLVSVPAHQDRYGAADELVGHLRRYSRADLTELLTSAGIVDVRVDAVGFPAGHVLEWGRNLLARRRLQAGQAGDGVAERTASSGRTFQPPSWAGRVTQVATAPARWAQRPFRTGETATGWMAVGRRPAS